MRILCVYEYSMNKSFCSTEPPPFKAHLAHAYHHALGFQLPIHKSALSCVTISCTPIGKIKSSHKYNSIHSSGVVMEPARPTACLSLSRTWSSITRALRHCMLCLAHSRATMSCALHTLDASSSAPSPCLRYCMPGRLCPEHATRSPPGKPNDGACTAQSKPALHCITATSAQQQLTPSLFIKRYR